MSFLDNWVSNFGDTASGGISGSSSRDSSAGKSTTEIDPEGMQYLLNSILSSNNGLAAVSSGAKSSGVYDSATQTLLQNDLIARAAGEVASRNVTTDTTSEDKKTGNESPLTSIGHITIICTYMFQKGLLQERLYLDMIPLLKDYYPQTIRGYHFWAIPVVKKMKQGSKLLEAIFLPLTIGRAKWYLDKKWTLSGFISVMILEKISFCLGCFLKEDRRNVALAMSAEQIGV